jgi:tRNA pseudouridine55 synthase
MANRRKGSAVHGWFILDKAAGMTSMHAVGTVRRLFNARKAGHAGTLDPLATGVLPIALGEATKTVAYAVEGEKSYRFTVRWGVETNTDDAEGSPTATADARPERRSIEALLPRFVGETLQTPPAFSAIKVEGARAYDLARAGEAVALSARPVHIAALELIATPDRETALFEAKCGKGTYVRALARDMGRALGCLGHVTALRRTRVGPFGEQDAFAMSTLEDAAEDGETALQDLLLPVEAALWNLRSLDVARNDAARLLQGQPVIVRGRDAPVATGDCYATCSGRLVALGRIEKGYVVPIRVFNFGGN